MRLLKRAGMRRSFFFFYFLQHFTHNQVNKKMLRAAKILERMVNQNTYDEIAQGIQWILSTSARCI